MPRLECSSPSYKLIEHYDHSDDEQQVDEAAADMERQESERPQDEQNDCD